MPLKVECVVDDGMHAEEPLGGARGFEALHLALSSSHYLMRVLGPIVLSQALLMVTGKPEVLEGSALGAQLIRDHPLRREALLAHELDGSAPVSPALNQDVEDLAVVLDAWSRKIVGWAMANHLRAELVLDAMEMAVGQRRPKDVIHHSDQGSQYTSVAFGKRCGEAGVRPSMGSVGDAYDNAMAESFFSTLEAELLSRRRFPSQAEAKMACFSYIEGWYNPVRLHSGLGYRSPITYEADMRAVMTKT